MRYFGSTTSGLPGKSRRCSLYRNPRRDSSRRTIRSGFVPRDLIRAMFQLRRGGVNLSAIEEEGSL